MLAQYVILGLLKERPMHGYEIKQRFERISGLFWKVSYGSLYPALRKLTDNGCISEGVSDPAASGRKVYFLTEQGNAVLLAWLQELDTEGNVNRNSTNEFLLRFIFFSYLSPEAQKKAVSCRLARLKAKLRDLREKREKKTEKADFYKKEMFDLIVQSVELEVNWLEGVSRSQAE